MTLLPELDDLLRPLVEGGPVGLAGVRPLDGLAVPEPYRTLLVHERDMTTALETFWGCALHLRILGRRIERDEMVRQVVLECDGDGRPVEFGAIRIHLNAFPDDAQAEILDGHRPLGSILAGHRLPFRSRPQGYFAFDECALGGRVFGLDGPHTLFGRHNLILGPRGETRLAEVVEILPPIVEAREP